MTSPKKSTLVRNNHEPDNFSSRTSIAQKYTNENQNFSSNQKSPKKSAYNKLEVLREEKEHDYFMDNNPGSDSSDKDSSKDSEFDEQEEPSNDDYIKQNKEGSASPQKQSEYYLNGTNNKQKKRNKKKRITVLESTMSNLAKILELKKKQDEEANQLYLKRLEEEAKMQLQAKQGSSKPKNDRGKNLEEYLKRIVDNRVGALGNNEEQEEEKTINLKEGRIKSKTIRQKSYSKLLPSMNRAKTSMNFNKAEVGKGEEKPNHLRVQEKVASILKKTRSRMKLTTDDKTDNFFKRRLQAFQPLATFINAKEYVDLFDPFGTRGIKQQQQLQQQSSYKTKTPEITIPSKLDRLKLNYNHIERKPIEESQFLIRKKDDISDALVNHLHKEFDTDYQKDSKFKDWDETHDLYFHDTTQKLFYNKDFIFAPTQSEQAGELKFKMQNLEKFVNTVLNPKAKLALNPEENDEDEPRSSMLDPKSSTLEPKFPMYRASTEIRTSRTEEPQSALLKKKGLPLQKKPDEKENIVKMVKQAAQTIMKQKENDLLPRQGPNSPRQSRFGRLTLTSNNEKRSSTKFPFYKEADNNQISTEESALKNTSRSENPAISQLKERNSTKRNTITGKIFLNKTTNQFYQSTLVKKGTLTLANEESELLPDIVRWNNKYDKAFLTPQDMVKKKILLTQETESQNSKGAANDGMFLTSVLIKEKSERERANVLRKKVSIDIGEFHLESDIKLKRSHFQSKPPGQEDESLNLLSDDREEKPINKSRRSTINVKDYSKKIDNIIDQIENVRDNYLSEIKEIEKINAGTDEMYNEMSKRVNPGLWSLSNTFDKLNYIDRRLVKLK